MSAISETEKKILDAFYAPVPSGPGDRAVLQKVINAVTVAGDEEITRLRAKVEQLEQEIRQMRTEETPVLHDHYVTIRRTKMTDIVDELLRDEITVGHRQREVNTLSIAAAGAIRTLRAKVEQLEREAVEHRAQIQRAQDTVLETLEDLNAALAKIDELQSATA